MVSDCKYNHDRSGKDDFSQFSKTFQQPFFISKPSVISNVVVS